MKLGKQLGAIRRELTANPKKAAALALLLVAAAWFWGPIVWRMAGGSSKGAPAKLPAATVASAGQQPAAGHSQSVRRTRPWNWNELLAARQRDPLTRAAAFDANWPQPFKVQRDVAATADAAGNPSLLLTPSEAGLVLGSIVFGRTTRAAVINGEIYHEGNEVSIAAPQGTGVTFRIRSIERERVALDRLERTYWLEFPRPKLRGKDRIEASEMSPEPPASGSP